MNRRRALRDLWAEVPTVHCQRECWAYCGAITVGGLERAAIARALGHPPPDPLWNAQHRCRLLTPEGLCSVYEARPIICRLWGAVEGLRCPWGCRVEPGVLGDDATLELIKRLTVLSGDDLAHVQRTWLAALRSSLETSSTRAVER